MRSLLKVMAKACGAQYKRAYRNNLKTTHEGVSIHGGGSFFFMPSFLNVKICRNKKQKREGLKFKNFSDLYC